MCGRFTLTTNLGAIAARFGVARFLEDLNNWHKPNRRAQ
jgi:hypothetical protein